MIRILGLLFALMMTTQVHAFRAYQGDTDLNIMNAIKCSTGLTCTKVGGKLNIVSSPTVTAGTFDVVGAEATDGILTISADESDDAADDWLFKSTTAGLLTVSNANSGIKLSMTGAGLLSVLGDEAGAASLTLSADESDDNGDDWVIGNSAANAFTLTNDTSGSAVAKLSLSTAGAMTSVVSITGAGTGAVSGFLRAQVASTTTAITAAQCGSTFVSNSADVMTLPEASTVLGCRLSFVCGTADDFDINPADGVDVLGITGALAGAAGDAYRCTDIGAGFEIEAVGADLWAVIGTNGTITDVN
jgi:hypothetical protein